MTAFALLLIVLFAPSPAYAHSFGQLYSLPIPFWMYLYAASATLIVSFFIIAYFSSNDPKKTSYPTKIMPRWIYRFISGKTFLTSIRSISMFLFILTILTGLFGTQASTLNFNMNFFWIIFTLGLFYFSALAGNVFATVNPLKVILEWYEKLLEEKISPVLKYPKDLSYYPAFIFYFLFIWVELFARTDPASLSTILIGYSILTFAGAFVFGKETWFRYCDFFSVIFRLVGKIAPFQIKNGDLHLRPPFVGLIEHRAENFSLLLFILFMLSSTAFDGFHSTTPYVYFYWQYINEPLRAIFSSGSFLVFQTISLLLSPAVFLIVYLILIVLMKVVSKSPKTVSELSLIFAFSLIPIAFVYNFAHYYTLIFTEGINIARLVSDPFGFEWNLFGTAKISNSIIIPANVTWHSQVAAILIGHIVGVYLAHLSAVTVFKSRHKAIVSQLPMLILMVIYTLVGLWILSQPITSG